MSFELGKPCGAVLPGTKHGAVATTPNGRLVSEAVIGRRTQSPPEPRRTRRRSSPTHTRMRVSRAPPSRGTIGSHSTGRPRIRPRSSLTARLHGRPLGENLHKDLHSYPCPGTKSPEIQEVTVSREALKIRCRASGVGVRASLPALKIAGLRGAWGRPPRLRPRRL